jgi:hypothetical protein
VRSTVEGAPTVTLAHDSADYTLQIAENLLRGNPHRAESKFLQEAIPACVALRTIASTVRLSVDLNSQPRLQAGEVEREWALRALFAKLVPSRPLLERPPQKSLCGAQILSQLTCELHRLDRRLEDAWAPSTSLRLVPLPVPGRNRDAPPPKLLPGTGRGTMRSMVEGGRV